MANHNGPVEVTYFDNSGEPVTVVGSLVRADNVTIEIGDGDVALVIEIDNVLRFRA